MPPARRRRCIVAACAIVTSVAAILGVTVVPAGADPARPTNFESRVLSVAPPTDGMDVEIAGGDAFIVLSVMPGHQVTVPDYGVAGDGRPYLRFEPDGTVKVNERSAAAAANESRFGRSPVDFDPDAEPSWHTVATDGTFAWHDHRVHLMVPDHLAVVDDTGRVDLGGPDGTWEVPLVVDGVETLVLGELIRLPSPTAWPWYVAAAAVFGALTAWVTSRTMPRLAPAILLGSVALVASYVSASELASAPDGSGASSVPLLTALGALIGALLALVGQLAGDRAASATRAGTALAAAALIWWAVTRTDVFANAILPSGLATIDRAATSAAIGLGAAVAVLLVWRPVAVTGRGRTPDATAT